MINRKGHLGCLWASYLIIGFMLTWLAWSFVETNVSMTMLVGLLALHFLAMSILIRRWLHLRWVWLLGYCSWFCLLWMGICFIAWMLISSLNDDAIARGMTIILGLPIGAAMILAPTGMLVWWNHLDVERPIR